jgi:hypothetical protein
MRNQKVKVKRDTQTVHNQSVAPWEIPILEFMFENGNVEALEEFEETERDWPDPGAEFHRLETVYGRDPETQIHNVASVFGNSRQGVRALGRAIEEAREDYEAAQAPRVRHVAGRAAATRFAGDPLLA